LFDWRDSNEAHNIIHVTMPNEKVNTSRTNCNVSSITQHFFFIE